MPTDERGQSLLLRTRAGKLVYVGCIVCVMSTLTPFCVLGWAPQIELQSTRVPNVWEMLKAHGVGSAKQDLIAALTNQDSEVRTLAAQALALDHAEDAIPHIENALSNETDGANRINMALDLAQLGDKHGTELLDSTCSNREAAAYLRILAAQNLLELGNEKCLSEVLWIAKNAPEEVDREGALALLPQYFRDSKGAPENVLDAVAGRLNDSSLVVRLQAATTLSQIGNQKQAARLQAAMSREPDPAIRQEMERALNELRSKPPR